MKVVGRQVLDRIYSRHADSRRWIISWLSEAESGVWTTPEAITDLYATATFASGNTVIFNDNGTDCQIEVVIAFRTGVIVVKR